MLKLIHRVLALCALLATPCGSAAFGQSGYPAVVTTSIGHTSAIPALAIAADNSWLASGAGTNDIKVWDIATGRTLRTLRGHSEIVWSVALLPANRIVSGSGDKTVRVWDAGTGSMLRTLSGHSEAVTSVASFPDGKRIASTSWDKSVRVWDTNSGALLRTLTGHTERVNAVVVSADGRLIASGGDDKTIRIWDAATGAPLRTLTNSAGITSLAISRDGGRLISGSGDKSIRVWDLKSGQLMTSISGHEEAVTKVTIAMGGRSIISASEDGTLRVWDTTGSAVHSTEKYPHSVEGLAPSADGRFVAFSVGYAIKLLDVATGQVFRTLQGEADPFLAMALSVDSRWMAVGGTDNRVNLIDLTTGRLNWSLAGHTVGVRGLAFSPDSATVISASIDGTMKLWEVGTGQLVRTVQNKDPVVGVAFSPNGKLVASTGFDSRVKLWDAVTGRILRVLNGKAGDQFSHLSFFPNGRQLASGNGEHGENAVRIWDVGNGKLLRSLEQQTSGLAVSRDGRTIATSGEGNNVALWDTATGQRLRDLSGHPAGASNSRSAVAMSPDGRWIALGGNDGLLELWNAATGTLHPTLVGHLDEVAALAFSTGGTRIVSAGWDGTARIWNTEGGELLATVAINRAGEWVTITPEGFFTASERGTALLHVVRGFETYAIDQFYQSLYRPDLVFAKLAGDPRGLVRDAAVRIDLNKILASGLVPQVTILSPRPGDATIGGEIITAAVSVTNRGGGVGRVEWRVNGLTVGIEPPPAPTTTGQSLRFTRGLALDEGDNEIEVIAYNASGLVASPPTRMNLTAPAPPSRPSSRLIILAAGINDYADARFKLANAVPDAKVLTQAFAKAGKGFYQDVDITFLGDEDVTRAKFEAAFASLKTKVRPSDVFVFYLAGHGKTMDGRYYFIPQNFRVEGGEPNANDVASAIAKLGIPQEQWQQWFANISAKRSILLFDTCESGTLTGDNAQSRELERNAAGDRLVQATGRTIFAAASGDQEANEGYRGHGLFTYNVIEALELADTDGNGVIDVAELAAYVHSEVSALSQQLFKAKQVPQVRMAGPNYGLAKAVPFFTDKPGIAIATKPTHRISAAVDILIQPALGARRVRKLDARAVVTAVRAEDGWTLVARAGRPLGYVASRELAPLQ